MALVQKTNGSVIYPSVARAIAKLGSDISLARRVRRIAAEDFALQMGVSRATLHRLENGEAGVSLHTVASALSALGCLELLAGLLDQAKDEIGLLEVRQQVPKRISRPFARKRRNALRDYLPDDLDNSAQGW